MGVRMSTRDHARSGSDWRRSRPCRLAWRANAPDVSGGHGIARNPGMALDLGFLRSMRAVNRSALERRVATLTKRRSHQGGQRRPPGCCVPSR